MDDAHEILALRQRTHDLANAVHAAAAAVQVTDVKLDNIGTQLVRIEAVVTKIADKVEGHGDRLMALDTRASDARNSGARWGAGVGAAVAAFVAGLWQLFGGGK